MQQLCRQLSYRHLCAIFFTLIVLGVPGKKIWTQNANSVTSDEGLVVVVSGQRPVEVKPFVNIEESLYEGWTVIHSTPPAMPGVPSSQSVAAGNAFGEMPITGSGDLSSAVTGYHGHRYVGSNPRGLGTFTGKLRSSVFTVRGDVIDFLIGGGRYKGRTCLSLFVRNNGRFQQVRSSTGNNNLQLQRKLWDVADFKGAKAYLEVVDLAPIEPWMHNGIIDPDEKYGFIIVDDIRQLDKHGRRVAEQEDDAHNFDFERVKAPRYRITEEISHRSEGGSGDFHEVFAIGRAGRVRWSMHRSQLSESLQQLDAEWSYTGDTIQGVKLGLMTTIPVRLKKSQYYLFPDLLYNGNRIGEAAHYFGEDFPEDALAMPGGYTIEDAHEVYGEWVAPQANHLSGKVSVRLERDETTDRFNAIYLMPPSMQFGQASNIDIDQRLTVHNGFHLKKTFYIYHAPKRTLQGVSNENQGYGQVLEAAWRVLYPGSPTNPPRSLTDDYDLRLHSLLDPYTLMQDVTVGGRTYRTWYVGRWELPDNFDFTAHSFVPTEYFHHYTGFSWSGMLGRASYTALEEYLRTGNQNAMRLGMDTLDLFADRGMSPLGIIFQVFYNRGDTKSDGALDWWASNCPRCKWKGFGTYGSIGEMDMGPLGEELYWYIKSYELLKASRVAEKQNWLKAVRSSLDELMNLYPAGDIPGRIDGTTGKPSVRGVPILRWAAETKAPFLTEESMHYEKPSEGGPEGFAYVIWAYTEYYKVSHDPRYLTYAGLLGDQLLGVMNQYGSLAGSEMDYFNIDKRMSHAAFAAFNDLYETTRNEKWRSAAVLGGNAFASWQYAYNVSFDGFDGLPANVFDYRTVGGTPVDVMGTTNNLVFDQGATEFIRLWNETGNLVWFQRARALLHQGTESSLDQHKRNWLNAHYQGPANQKILPFNSKASFDAHSLGGGTEDVLTAWPGAKGNWTTKDAPFLSLYMFAECFDWAELKQQYGSITYSFKWNDGGALDTLDDVTIKAQQHNLTISAHNMIGASETYPLKLLDYNGDTVRIDGQTYGHSQIAEGIPIKFGPRESKEISVELK